MKYRKVCRLMTLSWTDGSTFLQMGNNLLAFSKSNCLIESNSSNDEHSFAAR